MAILQRLYEQLPTGGQHLAVTAFGAYRHWLRFGPGYRESLRGYREREHHDCERLADYQAKRLCRLLGEAATRVPYYRNTWSSNQKRAASLGRLDELPILEKDAVRRHPREFIREDLGWRFRQSFHTSGSTGTPITTLWTAREIRDARALREARSANWAGVSFHKPRATFSGRIVVPDGETHGPFHRYNSVERQVYFSAFHLGPGTAESYVQALRAHRTEWGTGYAVSFYLLSRFILDQGLPKPKLRAVVTTSEKLTDSMREVMSSAYGCRIFEEYSTVENAVFASECEQGRLHLSHDAGVMEILRPDGSPCEPGETGEVVATSFVRQMQPFIRFRLGDLAAWDPEPCPCGRAFPVIQEVVGRLEDVLVGPDGRRLVRFHGVFVGLINVVEGQVIQEAVDRIRVRVLPGPAYGPADTQEIVVRVRQRIGDVHVEVEQVSSIPRTKAGKFKAVVSLIGRS